MKRCLTLFLLFFGFALSARAQNTVVQATIVDPMGNPYSFGTGGASLVCPGNAAPTHNGTTVNRNYPSIGLDGNGHFQQTVYDVNQLDQTGCSYRWTITWKDGVTTFIATNIGAAGSGTPITGAGPVNISAPINVFAVPLPQVTSGVNGSGTPTQLAGWQTTNTLNSIAGSSANPVSGAITLSAVNDATTPLTIGPHSITQSADLFHINSPTLVPASGFDKNGNLVFFAGGGTVKLGASGGTPCTILLPTTTPAPGQFLEAGTSIAGACQTNWVTVTAGGGTIIGMISPNHILYSPGADVAADVAGSAVTGGTGAIALTSTAPSVTPLTINGAVGQTGSLLSILNSSPPGVVQVCGPTPGCGFNVSNNLATDGSMSFVTLAGNGNFELSSSDMADHEVDMNFTSSTGDLLFQNAGSAGASQPIDFNVQTGQVLTGCNPNTATDSCIKTTLTGTVTGGVMGDATVSESDATITLNSPNISPDEYIANFSSVTANGSGTFNAAGGQFGVDGLANAFGSSTVTKLVGVNGASSNFSSGVVTNLVGVQAANQNRGGPVTNAYGFFSVDNSNIGTTNYDYFAPATTPGAGTNYQYFAAPGGLSQFGLVNAVGGIEAVPGTAPAGANAPMPFFTPGQLGGAAATPTSNGNQGSVIFLLAGNGSNGGATSGNGGPGGTWTLGGGNGGAATAGNGNGGNGGSWSIGVGEGGNGVGTGSGGNAGSFSLPNPGTAFGGNAGNAGGNGGIGMDMLISSGAGGLAPAGTGGRAGNIVLTPAGNPSMGNLTNGLPGGVKITRGNVAITGQPLIDLLDTWTLTGTLDMVRFNLQQDSGPSNAASNLLDLQVGQVSRVAWNKSGTEIWSGTTSGTAALGVAAVAGTPAQINLPTTTGSAGQFLQTNGASPQQTSWASAAQLICTGQIALTTGAIASGTRATNTLSCSGLSASTDSISCTFSGDTNAVTGYAPSASGGITLKTWASTNTINVDQVNNTSGSITPGAATLNCKGLR